MFARHALRKVTKNNVFLAGMQCRYFPIVKKFTKTHEWIELDTDTAIATIGITDHA